MVLFIFIFTLTGMQLFSDSFSNGFTSRQNWDSFFGAFMITFQVFTLYNLIKKWELEQHPFINVE